MTINRYTLLITLLIIVLAFVYFLIFGNITQSRKLESQEFIDKVVPIILKYIDNQTDDIDLDPSTKKLIKTSDIKKLACNYKNRFGIFKKYNGGKGYHFNFYSFKKGKIPFAIYYLDSEFSSDNVKSKVMILKDPQWRIESFKMISEKDIGGSRE